MSDENDERDDGEETVERTASGRKKRSDAGKPRGARKHVSTRFERRSKRATETIRELVRVRRPDLDVSGLSTFEVVDRDAEAWGDFFAQLAEWFVPFGAFLDLFFGTGLVRMLRIAPSFRAARRDLSERRERRAAERELDEEELEAEELRRRIEAEHAEHVRHVVEEPPEQELPLGVDPRAAWAARGGNGG